jgi:hypothetical protein
MKDDDTWQDKKAQENAERLKKSMRTFEADILVADKPNANGVSYTRECLEGAAQTFAEKGEPAYGVLFEGSTIPIQVSDIAFKILGMDFKDNVLRGRITTLETPKGVIAAELIDKFRESMTLGIAGRVEETDSETRDDGVLVVKKMRVDRVSLLSKETKA